MISEYEYAILSQLPPRFLLAFLLDVGQVCENSEIFRYVS